MSRTEYFFLTEMFLELTWFLYKGYYSVNILIIIDKIRWPWSTFPPFLFFFPLFLSCFFFFFLNMSTIEWKATKSFSEPWFLHGWGLLPFVFGFFFLVLFGSFMAIHSKSAFSPVLSVLWFFLLKWGQPCNFFILILFFFLIIHFYSNRR